MAATLITLIVISIAIGRYGFVSDPMPVHFGANGQPDGFQPKTWGSYLLVFAVPGVLLLGIQWGIWAFQRYGAEQTLRDKSSREVALPWMQAFLLVVLTTVFCALLASMSFQYYAAWLFVFVMAVAVLGSIAMAALFSPGILVVLLVWLN